MKFSPITVALTAFWFVTTSAAPVFSADTQIAQGKKEQGMSKGKGSEKVEEMVLEKEQRLQGQDNAMERGEGEKTGLIRQLEEGATSDKAKKAKKAK